MAACLLLSFAAVTTRAQNCPTNIDFETGTFNGWTCYTGATFAVGGGNLISLTPSGGPAFNQHTMYMDTGDVRDPYGGFSVNCPNGSGYSIRLGNDEGGGLAEGISYEFTIPAGQNLYSLIYHYAVVFQDPNHLENEQPRMEIEIMNVSDNNLIGCSSFTWIAYGNVLPGFFLSGNPGSTTPVWCKDWTAVSINLDGLAGKTVRLFFKTADCTFRRHFGYAYIDVNSECGGEFTGAAYCPDDTAVNVVAPYGYQEYRWYNPTFTQLLGTTQSLFLAPPPPVGTQLAVEVVPYNGFGCLDTLYANMIDTLKVKANAGTDGFSCNRNPVQIGAPPKPGLVYQWSPTAGLSNPNSANPLARPDVTTLYILTTKSSGGGCLTTDSVLVKASVIDNSLQLIGSASYCIDSDDSSILRVTPTDNIQWYRNGNSITGANKPVLKVTQSGTYSALLKNRDGCVLSTDEQVIFIDVPTPAIRYPLQYALINAPLSLKARKFGTSVSVMWSPGINLDTRTSYTPIFQGPSEQLYTIEIKAASGCVTVDTQMVKTVPKVDLLVPNAFTPNRDGLNDYLRPILMGVKELRYFRIYNRWGEILFEMRNADTPGWDGNFRGAVLGTQVIVWLAEGLGVDNKIYLRKGTCVLVR